MLDSSAHGGTMAISATLTLEHTIRSADSSDLEAVVDVHLASFQAFFLTFLGRGFLERLYREIHREPGAVFLVASLPDRPVAAFAAGVPNLPAFYSRAFETRWLSFGWASTRAVLKKPSILPRLWRARRAADQAREAACPAVLMSIAVAPEAMGHGLGKSLVAAFRERLLQQGIARFCLTTDRDDNEATLGFYEGLGFRMTHESQTPEGRWIREYLMEA
jgi:ribosomal protein S18 acetylase RimI-like enzyme